MRKKYFFIVVLLPLLFVFDLQVKAGNGLTPGETIKPIDFSSPDTAESKRSLIFEFDFGTDRGYQLRRKTAGSDTSQKYISPSINYEAPSGFYTSANLYKTPGAKKSWDELTFGLGWDFKISKNAQIDGSAGYTRYAYNQAIKKNGVTPANNSFTAYAKHDFGIVALKLTGDYYFGGTYADEDLILDIDHEFYIDNLFSKKDELSIDPSLAITEASLNYYRGNIQIPDTSSIPPNLTKKQKEVILAQLRSAQAAFDDFSTFRLAYYEFTLPVNYQIGKFDMEVAFHYSIPNNLPAVLNAKSYSYFTALISWDFLK
jgi:hypothetical protein